MANSNQKNHMCAVTNTFAQFEQLLNSEAYACRPFRSLRRNNTLIYICDAINAHKNQDQVRERENAQERDFFLSFVANAWIPEWFGGNSVFALSQQKKSAKLLTSVAAIAPNHSENRGNVSLLIKRSYQPKENQRRKNEKRLHDKKMICSFEIRNGQKCHLIVLNQFIDLEKKKSFLWFSIDAIN